MEKAISRKYSIGGKQIVVFDNLFLADEINKLHQFLARLPYHLSEVDTTETPHNLNWVSNLPLQMATGMPILKKCVDLAREFYTDRQLELRRVYVNLNRYGDMQYAHRDAEEGVTALYYANAEWRDHWGGETVFYDDDREPVYVVAPKPGRLALFHPLIMHRGGVPSRDCWEARLTVAFKLEPGP
jgi:Rps23 Pro-64 3,4-dihydroxylase Tpa1-like proline 4-hydroxylase